jgi:hypothetical protein
MSVKVDKAKGVVYVSPGTQLAEAFKEVAENTDGEEVDLFAWEIQFMDPVQEFRPYSEASATFPNAGIVCKVGEYIMQFKEYHGPKKEEDQGTVNGRKRIGFK